MQNALILASASRYRRQLLARLRLPFQVHAAEIDETRLESESPRDLVTRLARTKATTVADRYPGTWVIGADQIAVRGDQIVGKPGNAARSIEQLRAARAQTMRFLTAVCLVQKNGARSEQHLDETQVTFRDLSEAEIARYVELEQPYDCAGAFKSEALGIVLFERIQCEDPTALVGLPLIWLSGALGRAGLSAL